ncbi:SGNH/GDSL hydrolase family protein [Fictibacillus terranigra]|uniref:SGNH/GDSL hydrolase family protein n=1 Tax=Fictibacillus terranigra TaxID=3058424 RepID=A0ABT8E8B4_9BACL|nr:SGNH/GDSL hydrolase family protein [Fictibacillus sp. CENA-BCM004]MDN4074157.1 SGNH/GDSL hydrolase family protein [Fictibacillus sp. CENA-BCM004]
MKKSFAALLAASTLFSFAPLTAYADHQEGQKNVEYVALGDSIAAGMTPYGDIDKSYPDFISSYFKRSNVSLKDYDNFGVPGYTSEQLKNDVLANPEVIKEIRGATHITINIGANDLFRKLMTDPRNAWEGIEAAKANLQTILEKIDLLNADVHVYVMGYYNPFSYYDKESQNFLVPLNDALNSAIEEKAGSNGDLYVPTGGKIDSHFEKYMPNPEDNHLNVKGYKAIAKQFWHVMEKDVK